MATVASDDFRHMLNLTEGLSTKSAKIRKLSAAGYSRAEIAKFLNIRYQHVRNVLLQPLAGASGVADSAPQPSFEGEPTPALDMACRLFIDEQGRISMPATLLSHLGLHAGGSVTAWVEDGQIALCGPDKSMERLRALIERHVPADSYSSDDLIAERRADAAKEERRHAS